MFVLVIFIYLFLTSSAVVTCNRPSKVDHGSFSPDQHTYKYKDAIKYSCDEGYQVSGSASQSCSSSGTFTSAPPTCISEFAFCFTGLFKGSECVCTTETFYSLSLIVVLQRAMATGLVSSLVRLWVGGILFVHLEFTSSQTRLRLIDTETHCGSERGNLMMLTIKPFFLSFYTPSHQ